MSGYVGNKRSVSFVSAELPIRKGLESIVEEDGSYRLLDGASLKRSDGNTVIHSDGTIEGVDLSPIQNQIDSIEADITSLNSSVDFVEASVNQIPPRLESFRNKIINGNFDVWQRGTSQTSSGYGSADRWFCPHSGSSKTASQQPFTIEQTEVPGNPKYYLRHVVTSVAGASNYVAPFQKIESVSTLAGKTATLSFWAKADSNKNIATEIVQNFGSGGNPNPEVTNIGVTTHSLTTSWQKFTVTTFIPYLTNTGQAGGTPLTIGTNGNDWIGPIFWFDAGSSLDSRTNSLGNQSGTFDIAQVQLEEGPVATPFEHRPFGLELSLCQRYYEKSFSLGTTPANGTGETSVVYTQIQSGYGMKFPVTFKTRKRAAGPTIVVYNPYDTTPFRVADVAGTNDALTHTQVGHITETGFTVTAYSNPVAIPDYTGQPVSFNWTADAEL